MSRSGPAIGVRSVASQNEKKGGGAVPRLAPPDGRLEPLPAMDSFEQQCAGQWNCPPKSLPGCRLPSSCPASKRDYQAHVPILTLSCLDEDLMAMHRLSNIPSRSRRAKWRLDWG